MIAKFHSAPGHSMETTLTINIPPPNHLRSGKGERVRDKQKEKEKERGDPSSSLAKDRDKEDEWARRDKEKDEENIKKEEKEREREKRALAERSVSYKDKFQKMREKYDRAMNTRETEFQEYNVLNAKVRKLQAENDLLLDAIFLGDTSLYDHHFPSGQGRGSPPIGHPPQQHASQTIVMTPYHVNKQGYAYTPYAQPPQQQGMPVGPPLPPGSRYVDHSSAFYDAPPPLEHAYNHPGYGQNHYHSHYRRRGQHSEQPPPQQQQQHPKAHPYYVYPPRETVPPEPVQPHVQHGHPSQHPVYAGYAPPGHHHVMPPPPMPPLSMGIEAERERLGREWERDRSRLRDRDRAEREWEWERERDQRESYVSGQDSVGVPPNTGYGGVGGPHPSSNGYNTMTPNGHSHGHGHPREHAHSVPPGPPSLARPHGRHDSQSRSPRSESRRPGNVMDMDNMGAIPLKSSPSPDADVDMSLGGPVHLGEDLEAARERGRRGRSSASREGSYSRRGSAGRKGKIGSRTPTQSEGRSHQHVIHPKGVSELESVPVGVDSSSSRQARDREERQSPVTSKSPSTKKSNARENVSELTSSEAVNVLSSVPEKEVFGGGEVERDVSHRRTRSQTQRYGSRPIPTSSVVDDGQWSRRKTRKTSGAAPEKRTAVATVVASAQNEEEGDAESEGKSRRAGEEMDIDDDDGEE